MEQSRIYFYTDFRFVFARKPIEIRTKFRIKRNRHLRASYIYPPSPSGFLSQRRHRIQCTFYRNSRRSSGRSRVFFMIRTGHGVFTQLRGGRARKTAIQQLFDRRTVRTQVVQLWAADTHHAVGSHTRQRLLSQ